MHMPNGIQNFSNTQGYPFEFRKNDFVLFGNVIPACRASLYQPRASGMNIIAVGYIFMKRRPGYKMVIKSGL